LQIWRNGNEICKKIQMLASAAFMARAGIQSCSASVRAQDCGRAVALRVEPKSRGDDPNRRPGSGPSRATTALSTGEAGGSHLGASAARRKQTAVSSICSLYICSYRCRRQSMSPIGSSGTTGNAAANLTRGAADPASHVEIERNRIRQREHHRDFRARPLCDLHQSGPVASLPTA